MNLRKEQISQFQEARWGDFEDRLVRHLRQRSPHMLWNVEEETLRERVRRLSDEAAGFGLENEVEIKWYVETAVERGDDFASRDAKILDILRNAGLNGNSKMAAVDARLYPPEA